MANPITAERFAQELLGVLNEALEQPVGAFLDRGTSLFETLATVTAEEASRSVSANCASIAAQIAHLHFYIQQVLNYMRGQQGERADWGHIWRTVQSVNAEEWEASKARLRQAYDLIKAQIATNHTMWEAENSIGGAIALLAHTAYHLGEIRQALCTVRTSG